MCLTCIPAPGTGVSHLYPSTWHRRVSPVPQCLAWVCLTCTSSTWHGCISPVPQHLAHGRCSYECMHYFPMVAVTDVHTQRAFAHTPIHCPTAAWGLESGPPMSGSPVSSAWSPHGRGPLRKTCLQAHSGYGSPSVHRGAELTSLPRWLWPGLLFAPGSTHIPGHTFL